MIKSSNTQNAIMQRKYQDSLKLCGTGMLVFSFWSIAKFLLQFMVDGMSIMGDISEISAAITIGIIVVTVIIMILDFLLRFYIWRSCYREAENQGRGNGYIILTIVMFIINVAIFIFVRTQPQTIEYELDASGIMEMIIDLTDDGIMLAVLFNVFKVKQYAKLREQED